MIEQELSQLYWLNYETEQLQKNLEDFRSNDLYNSPLITGMPKSNTKCDKIAEYIAERDNLENIILLNLHRIQLERAKLETYINELQDSQTRLIFRLRHINGLTWEQIGEEIGYSYEGVRKIYKKELKKLQ